MPSGRSTFAVVSRKWKKRLSLFLSLDDDVVVAAAGNDANADDDADGYRFDSRFCVADCSLITDSMLQIVQ